jgi:hypothetical protein
MAPFVALIALRVRFTLLLVQDGIFGVVLKTI